MISTNFLLEISQVSNGVSDTIQNLKLDKNILENNSYIFNNISKVPIPLNTFLLSIILAFLLSTVLSRVYIKKGNSLSNRKNLASIFPLLSITTAIVIGVIKSSLALSLGLVGALSVIRFRTPIKEPEELTYIFLCIAIGLGLGAEQYLATSLGLLVALFAIFINSKFYNKKDNLLNIQVSKINIERIDEIIELVQNYSQYIDLKNLVINKISNNDPKKEANINLLVLVNSFESINNLTNRINSVFPNSEVFISDYQ